MHSTHCHKRQQLGASMHGTLLLMLVLMLPACASPEGSPDASHMLSKARRQAKSIGILELRPQLASSSAQDRRAALRKLRAYAFKATRPGAEAERRQAEHELRSIIRQDSALPAWMRVQLRQYLAIVTVTPRPADPSSKTGPKSDEEVRRLETLRQDAGTAAVIERYRELATSKQVALRAAALRALHSMGKDDLFQRDLDCLDSDNLSLRQIGLAALAKSKDAKTTTRLLGAWDKASPRTRGGILRVLLRRGDPAGRTLLQRTVRTGSRAQRVDAIELLGSQDSKQASQLLLQVATEPEVEIRRAAAAALIQLVQREITEPASAAELQHARELLQHVLEHSKDRALQARALNSLARCADASSLRLARPLLVENQTREAAARVCLAAAKTVHDDSERKQLLTQIFKLSKSRASRRGAVTALQAMGVSTAQFARKAGFLDHYFVLGGFAKTNPEELGRHPFGSKGPEPSQAFGQDGKQRVWQRCETKDPDGLVDLRFLKPNSNTAAYAFTVLDWPEKQKLLFKIGSDDSVALWINGKLMHANAVARGVTVDEDKVAVTLEKGPNRILIKIGQGGGGWGFCVRVCTRQGQPLDLSTEPTDR